MMILGKWLLHPLNGFPSGSCYRQKPFPHSVWGNWSEEWGVRLWAVWVNHQLPSAKHLWVIMQRPLERELKKYGEKEAFCPSFILIFPPTGWGENKGGKPLKYKSRSSALHGPYSQGSTLQSFFFFSPVSDWSCVFNFLLLLPPSIVARIGVI